MKAVNRRNAKSLSALSLSTSLLAMLALGVVGAAAQERGFPTPTNTPVPGPTSTATNTPQPTSTNTPTNTPLPTSTNTPTNTPVPPTVTSTATNTPTSGPTNTPTTDPTNTATQVPPTPTDDAGGGQGEYNPSIPTTSDLGMLVMIGLLAGAGALWLRFASRG